MNDTNLTSRQLAILNALYEKPLKSVELLKQLSLSYPLSKATLIRDITKLTALGLIASEGRGKATEYFVLVKDILKPVSLDEYFNEGSLLRRSGHIPFNNDVFDNLDAIFSDKEIISLKKECLSLNSKKGALDPNIFKREIERFTVEFAWKSSRIEGNTYSLLETEILIKQMKEAVGKTKYEAIMILNHKNAVDYILNNPNKFKIVDIADILNLHEILTRDLEITPGIRNNPIAITGTEFVPLNDKKSIETALEKGVRAINNADFPLTKALLSLALVSYIQPFVDGNKRTARTLSNAILIAYDFLPLSYRNLDEVEFLKAVLLFYEANNLYHLKRILVEQYKYSQRNYFRENLQKLNRG